MPIKLSPGCPCCTKNTIVILPGVYCSRLKCSVDESGQKVSTLKTYYPKQTIKLTKLGTGFRHDQFIPSESVIDECLIEDEIELDAIIYINEEFNLLLYINDDGSIDRDRIASDFPEIYSNLIEKGWPPALLFGSTDIVFDTWYRLDFDLGKFGKVYKIFYVGTASYFANHYYSLNSINFRPQIYPGDPPSAIPIVQDLKFECCDPCIIDRTKDINLKVSYDIDLSSTEYDTCMFLNNGEVPVSHTVSTIENSRTSLDVTLKWNHQATPFWESEEYHLYDQVDTTIVKQPWCAARYLPCKIIKKYKKFVKFKMSCFLDSNFSNLLCDDIGNPIYYYMNVTEVIKDIITEYDPPVDPESNIGWYSWYSFFLTSTTGIIRYCNVVTDCAVKSYGGFLGRIKNVNCENLSGDLFDTAVPDPCLGSASGDITGG